MDIITKRFEDLERKVTQRVHIISVQLQSIDSSLLNAFITVTLSSFLSQQLGIFIYWVPSSFILMWLILFYSLINSIKNNKYRKNYGENYRGLSKRTLFLLLIKFKNSVPVFRTIGVIFLVSLSYLVMREIGIIAQDISFSVSLPLISCLLFMILPLLLNRAISLLTNRINYVENNSKTIKINIFRLFSILIYVIIFIGGMLILPILSLIELKYFFSDLSRLLLIMYIIILQIICSLILMNYFSAILAKKELNLQLYELLNIQNVINSLQLNEKIDETKYNELRIRLNNVMFINISVDDSLIVNYYVLDPDLMYLSNIDDRLIIEFPGYNGRKKRLLR